MVDDIGDIAESSDEESKRGTEEICQNNLSNILESVEVDSTFLPEESDDRETEEVGSKKWKLVQEIGSTSILQKVKIGASILPPSDLKTKDASSQPSSDNQASDTGFLKSSEASLLQMCLERSEETT